MNTQRTELYELWNRAESTLSRKHLVVVCNAKGAVQEAENHGGFQFDTEYFSDDEFEQVVSMFSGVGIPADYFTYEDEFFRYVLSKTSTNLLVYNAAQSGTGAGRKALIPAFCNLHNIPCTGSNPYVVALCRHKYHVNRILKSEGIPVPQTHIYSDGWMMDRHPIDGTEILIKPIYESASIGIDDTSIQNYTAAIDKMIDLRSMEHQQPIIAQEFIHGYEVEVPMVRVQNHVFQLPAVGIAVNGKQFLDNEILNYERIYFDRYEFYNFSEHSVVLQKAVCDCAANVANILGMEGLCRVDFRVKQDGSFFVTDVSTNPHFVAHSSVHFAFQHLGMASNDIARTILSAALCKR